MAKQTTEIVYLVSSAGTGYFYSLIKNKRKNKIKVKKYDPIAKKHVMFEEKKLSRVKKKVAGGKEATAGEKGEKAEKAPKKEKAKGGKEQAAAA